MNQAMAIPKLAAPAQRALANEGIENLEDLAKLTETDFSKLHGIGPNALKVIQKAMDEKGLKYSK